MEAVQSLHSAQRVGHGEAGYRVSGRTSSPVRYISCYSRSCVPVPSRMACCTVRGIRAANCGKHRKGGRAEGRAGRTPAGCSLLYTVWYDQRLVYIGHGCHGHGRHGRLYSYARALQWSEQQAAASKHYFSSQLRTLDNKKLKFAVWRVPDKRRCLTHITLDECRYRTKHAAHRLELALLRPFNTRYNIADNGGKA